MLSQQDADACVWDEAQRYLRMTYAELSDLAKREIAQPGGLSGWRSCGGEEVYVDVSVSAARWIRRRITVELILSAGEQHADQTAAVVYFERYSSGKIRGPWHARHKKQ